MTSTQRLYIGTYTTQAGDDGIFACDFDPASGALATVGAVGGVMNPAFLALSADRRLLYAVSETGDFEGTPGGAVAAFAIDGATGLPRLLNAQPTHGAHPCHLTLTADGRYVVTANYSGGSITVFPIDLDGTLGAHTALVAHSGSGPNAQRQEKAHAHCAMRDPYSGDIFVADLGVDRIFRYQVNAQGALLAVGTPLETAPGAGPRHLTFSADGRALYVINELDSTIGVYVRPTPDAPFGTAPVQAVSTLPPDFSGESTCAELELSPDGRFLYGSNRGHDSLAIFAVDPASGQLSPAGHASTLGQTPRNFAITPDGGHVLAANQNSDSIVVFRRDAATGALTPTGQTLNIPRPVCVLFA
jgi:6-phosphogluconolactonase